MTAYDKSIYSTKSYFQRGSVENGYYDRLELRPDQLAAIQYMTDFGREPKHILSVGVGVGFLEHTLAERGLRVTGQDVFDNRDFHDFPLIVGHMDAIPEDDYDTLLFVESIEHIPAEEFDRNWPRLAAMLTKTSGVFIVANWESLHPIPDNGWDHIRIIDDALYDSFERVAQKRLVRKGSHLALQF